MLKKRNFRDLSIYSCNGKHLKENAFFRSGKLYKLNRQEVSELSEKGVKTILDLRSPEEIGEKADTPIEGIKSISIPFIKSEMFGITHEKKKKTKVKYEKPPHMPTLYRQMITSDITLDGLKKALEIIFDPKREGGILWHCTAGKDRAGLLTALFLYALGYDEKTIYEDYEKTDEVTEKQGRKYRALIRLFMWNGPLAQGVYLAMRADRTYLQEAFLAAKEAYGSIDNLLKNRLGVNEEMVEAFKARYMIPCENEK